MKASWITVALLIACGTGWADYNEDLQFATKLGAHGMSDMAMEVLDRLERSGDPAAARAGRYGKAMLDKQQASIARLRFLAALESGAPPPVSREDVLKIYEGAKPKVEEYVTGRPDDVDARFLLAELLQEYAEFLVGADYPDELAAQAEQLVSQNATEAEKLFEAAIGNYTEVATKMKAAVSAAGNLDATDERVVRLANAQYSKAHARMRWALLYPKGPKFSFRSDEAIEELDEFLSEHFEDLVGAYAMLDLGRLYLERGLRKGDADDAETAVNYFSTLFTTVPEDPAIPETTEVIAKAFYWYAKACNAIAEGAGALKKKQPVYLENTIRAGTEMRQRLKQGARHPFALKAQLLVADAFAAQDRMNDAVALAGDTLANARVAGQRQVATQATDKLTGWVARATGTSALDPSLLLQIGESLASQGRLAGAITFYEKAIVASTTEDEKEKVAYPAQVRIANGYRGDRRYYAGALVAMEVVDAYLKSGQEEDSAFGQIAGDACNTARLCLKQIAENTNRSEDQARYQRVLDTFRDKFPGHPENSDSAFTSAKELYNDGKYDEAARAFLDIAPSSRNYWLAQRLVPACYRNLATEEKNADKAKQWHEKTLAASEKLLSLAESKGDEPGAESARQASRLLMAMSLASLERWPDALAAIDDYLQRYPDKLVQRGLEYLLKIDAHLALGQVEQAEQALVAMEKKVPEGSTIYRRALYNVFSALRKAYQAADDDNQRLAMAKRAALLLEVWMEGQKEQDYKLKFFLGDVYKDAERFADASAAYEAAADAAPDDNTRQALTLRAAEMQYRAIKAESTLPRAEMMKALEKTRQLFTDFLIDPRATDQQKVLKDLGNPTGWPSNETFGKVKRNASALRTAAALFIESSPPGIDGRYVAVRLIHHLHQFTKPVADPATPALDEFIPTWWEGAQLKLEAYLAIAQSGAGPQEKSMAKDGYAFARKLIFEYPSMDNPKRVRDIKALEAQLRILASR